MDDMVLYLVGAFFAGSTFTVLMMLLFNFCDDLLQKEIREGEEKAAQEGGNCF